VSIREAAVRHEMSYDKAPVEGEWDADAADGRLRSWAGGPEKEDVDWAKYREGFSWYDTEDSENFGAYKLPHHDIVDDRLSVIWRGVAAAAAVVQGGRGGADIPDADMDAVKTHLARHYEEFDRTPPWVSEAVQESEKKPLEKPQEKEVEEEMPETITEAKGKGIVASEEVATMEVDQRRLLRESVVKKLKAGSLKEQWTAPVGLTPSPASRLRNFIILSEILAGEAGDTITVPYVKDFDLDILTNVGDTLTPKTGLLGTVTTTLKEAAATTNVPYADIEKMTEEVIGELEGKFGQAAYRAEDKELVDVLYADADVPEVDHSGDSPADFKASYIAQALCKMIAQGKEVNFGDCVLVISASMYDKLLADIAGTQSLAFARPDAIRDGQIRQLMGVNVSITNYLPSGGTPAKYSAYLIHKNSVVLAPKRDILIETERDTAARKVKVTGSHTFGRVILDNKAAVEIKTAFTSL